MPLAIDDLLKAHYFEFQELAVSPDDEEALAVFGNWDMPHDDYAFDERNRSIWRISLRDGAAVQLLAPEEDARHCAWSPDGSRIAYVSRRSGRNEVWVMNRDGSDSRQITEGGFEVRNPYESSVLRWSPDGKRLSYTVLPQGSRYSLWQRFGGKQASERGRIFVTGPEAKPFPTDSDCDKLLESAIFVLDLSLGQSREIARNKGGAYGLIGWLSDGESILASSGHDLLKIDVSTGERQVVCSEPGLLVRLRKSEWQAVRLSDTHIELGHVLHGSFRIETRVELPEGFQLQGCTPDMETLFGTIEEGASLSLVSIHCPTANTRRVTNGDRFVSGPVACLNRESSAIVPLSGPAEPTELFKCARDGSLTRIGELNHGLDRSNLGQVSRIQYPSDKWTIEAFVTLPPNYEAGKKLPTLVFLHGGPECLVRARFTDFISARAESAAHWLAAHGYAILAPNFRGSSGYGPKFESQISDHRMMSAPFADLMAGVDYLIDQGIADPDALGVYGSSFGGQLTAWTVTQTERFKGAVAALAVCDQLSQDRSVGTPFYALKPNRLGKADPKDVWLRPEIYRQTSPVENVTSVKTPTLLIDTGAEQQMGWLRSYANAFREGLQAMGVECYQVFYTRAFHNGGWDDDYKADYMKRILAWFDHCLKGTPLPDWFRVSR